VNHRTTHDAHDRPLLRWVSRRSLLAAGLVGLAGCSGAPGLQPPVGTNAPAEGTPVQPTSADGLPRNRFAAPGSVQSTIDEAAAGGYSRVYLHPETEYRPKRTWEVKRGVTLDYNGAHVRVTRNVDVHDIQPGGQVVDPVVDLRHVTGRYTSSVFVFDSRRHGFYGNNRLWHVVGGITRGRTGEGTVFEFAQGGESSLYFVHVDHAVWRAGTVVDMHRGDAFGINGVHVYGLWYGFETGIRMRNRSPPGRNVDNISGNQFEVIAQPNDSRILWDLEVGRFNVLRGKLWDFGDYSDVMWRIHAADAEARIGNVLHWFPVGGTEQSLLNGTAATGVFDDRLGDDRNRVVIPWLQGYPVGSFGG